MESELRLEHQLGTPEHPALECSARHKLQNTMYGPKTHWHTQAWTQLDQSRRNDVSLSLKLERLESNTWEVTSTWVQKHNLSTMLSR